jgi:hypothetical protein
MKSGRGRMTERKKCTENFSMKSEEKIPFGRDDRKMVVIKLLMIKEKCPFAGHESTWWSGGLASLIINL